MIWGLLPTLLTMQAVADGAPRTLPPPGYTLVWSDEFDGNGPPDPVRWAYDTHANETGWYNRELQYYSAGRMQNARVEGGRLVITARREALSDLPDHGGQRYSSARLVTRDRATWTYGYFEIRARLPCGGGSWPAIWMLGSTAPWPDGGEIDIMEQVGNRPTTVHGTIHNRATAGTHGDGGSIDLPTACTQFHRYQLLWTRDALEISVDDSLVHRYARAGRTADGWPFDKPHYLLLNLAIGGAMGGPVDDAIFPIAFDVDYVRVFQRQPSDDPR